MADNPNFDFNVPPQFEKITKNIKLIITGLVVLLLGFSTFYTVDPEEVGIVVRLGKFIDTKDPGLHFKIPILDQVQLVPVERQLKQEFGYRTTAANITSQYRKAGYEI